MNESTKGKIVALLDVVAGTLRDEGVTHMVGTASREIAGLCEVFEEAADLTRIFACREGEAVAIASGLVAAGSQTCLSMENLGLFECLDTLRGLPCDMGIGLPMFIGYAGRGGDLDAFKPWLGNMASQVARAGNWTEPVLDAVGIERGFISEDKSAEANRAIIQAACRAGAPYAVLVDVI